MERSFMKSNFFKEIRLVSWEATQVMDQGIPDETKN